MHLRPSTYATVGGSIPRLLQALVLGPLMSRLYNRHVRIVALKPNKDLAYMNELFEAGRRGGLQMILEQGHGMPQDPRSAFPMTSLD